MRVVDDLSIGGRSVAELLAAGEQVEARAVVRGPLAAAVRDRRVPLELCPSSNVQTGAATSIAQHPITLLRDLGFRVTLNTDNRLMSGTSMTREARLLVDEAGWSLADLRRAAIDAMQAAFLPAEERQAVVEDVLVPGYAALGI